MSLRKRSIKKFNRVEIHEDTQLVVDLQLNEDFDRWGEPLWWTEWTWDDLMSYEGDGFCHSMKDYHWMHLLTLLRSLQLQQAANETYNRGW